MEEVVPSPTDRKERGYTHGTEQNRSCGVYSGGNCRNGSHTNASCSHGSGSESGLSQECPYHHQSRGSCDLEERLNGKGTPGLRSGIRASVLDRRDRDSDLRETRGVRVLRPPASGPYPSWDRHSEVTSCGSQRDKRVSLVIIHRKIVSHMIDGVVIEPWAVRGEFRR